VPSFVSYHRGQAGGLRNENEAASIGGLVNCVNSGHFRVHAPCTSRIVEPLFPKEQVPASIPPTPREVGTTLTPIVAFPCMRTDYWREYFGLLQVRHSCHQVAVEPLL
jgi:hypothetical protein